MEMGWRYGMMDGMGGWDDGWRWDGDGMEMGWRYGMMDGMEMGWMGVWFGMPRVFLGDVHSILWQ